MKDFIEYLIKNIVNEPEQVDIRVKEGDLRMLIEIRVAPTDVGKVVGNKGRVIHSLRTIAISIGMRLGHKVQLEVVQDKEEALYQK